MISRVAAVVRKEFREMRRDPITISIAAALPLVMLFLFGYAISLEVENVPTAVLDRDRSASSARLVEALVNSGDFEIRARPADERTVRTLLDDGTVRLAVVVPRGYERSLQGGDTARVQTLVDATFSATAAVIRDELDALLQDVAGREIQVKSAGPLHAGSHIRVVSRVWYNPSLSSETFVVPGLFAVILMGFPPLLTVLGVVREKESGSIQQIYVSPLRPWEFVAGKMLPYVAVAFVELASLVLVGTWWFDLPFRGSAALFLAGATLYIFCTVGIGLLVSTLTSSQVVGVLAALIITLMPAFLFSGFMYPISSMAEGVQWYTRLFPARYFTEVSRGVFLKGTGLRELGDELAILAGYTGIVFAATSLRFRKKVA